MAFKMKAGKEGPMKKNFGISPMKNYKKGYYGEGSSMKLTDDSKFDPGKSGGDAMAVLGEMRMEKKLKPRFAMKKEVKQLRRMKKELTPTSRYTGRKPQSQMTDAEYKRMLQKKKK
tara:strand:- start:412 stop:759 length:348 start_codon:yes stop_codon:yes gene_type:complete